MAGGLAVARFFRQAHEDLGLVGIEEQIVDDLAGIHGLGAVHQLVQVRGGRIGGHGRQRLGVIQPVLDLVVEHQRQAGETDDEQEDRADQAGPFMDQIPGFDGGRGCHGDGRERRARPPFRN
ncbi:hypothetical protein D3C72_1772580 [compost metagenome]